MKYTSLKLSKLLAENGFEGESKYMWFNLANKWEVMNIHDVEVLGEYPAYDILNDLCVKYAKEMFGKLGYYSGNKFTGIKSMREAYDRVDEFEDGLVFKSFEETAESIFRSIQHNKQDEAEEYIWKHCLFNPKNK